MTDHPLTTLNQVLDRVHLALRTYVVLPNPEATDAVTLWIAATHAQKAWAHAPRLVIRGPEKRCGKSRLMDIVEGMCHNPIMTVNASSAAIYRSIGTDDTPTLLIDEADTIFGTDTAKSNEDLRGLLNAGHQRNRPALRWDANAHQLEKIPTFAMAALAGIGAMPDTIEDRAVIIRMRRRTTNEKVSPFRHRRDSPALRTITQALRDHISPHLTTLEKAEPVMPVEDRAADTWEPLVAIADLAEGTWPTRARNAIAVLNTDTHTSAEVSTRIRLLIDIRTAFATLGDPPATSTIELLRVLNQDPEAPWSGMGPNGLTGKKLGDLLREFEITSTTVRFSVGQAKGYYQSDFIDSWGRYCPETPTPSVPSVPGLSSENELGTLGTDTPDKRACA